MGQRSSTSSRSVPPSAQFQNATRIQADARPARLFWVSTRNHHKGSAANILPLSPSCTKNLQWKCSSQKCSIQLLELHQRLLPGSCTVILSRRRLGQTASAGLWGAEEWGQKPQGEKDEASVPGGDYHKGWTHMSLTSEGMRTGWKRDKCSEFSSFQFYFSVVECSCKQKLKQKSMMQ